VSKAQILDVGNCDPDHSTLSRMLNERFDVSIDRVMFVGEALEKLAQNPSYDLVLVNRLIFADRSPGIELIRQMQANDALKNVPIMMVSNFEEAQQQAVEAGAVEGFGKDAIFEDSTAEQLSKYLSSNN